MTYSASRPRAVLLRPWLPREIVCAGYNTDVHTGKTIYGYVADSCADDNFWCGKDTHHLDISTPYLRGEGLLTPSWNGAHVTPCVQFVLVPGHCMAYLRG